MINVKEIVRDLIDIIENGGTLHENRRNLAILDAEEVQEYIKNLELQIEETEYLIYNSDIWINDIVDFETNKLENDILECDGSMDELTSILDDFTNSMKKHLTKQAMIELKGVKKVYV